MYFEKGLNVPYHSHYRGQQRHALLEIFCKLDISAAVVGWNVDNRTCYLICISVSLQMEITRAYPIFQGTLQHVTEFRKIITLLRDAEFPRADSVQTITTFLLSLSLSLFPPFSLLLLRSIRFALLRTQRDCKMAVVVYCCRSAVKALAKTRNLSQM